MAMFTVNFNTERGNVLEFLGDRAYGQNENGVSDAGRRHWYYGPAHEFYWQILDIGP